MYKNPKSFGGKLICWFTKGQYYHCEFLFSDDIVFSAESSSKNWGVVKLPYIYKENVDHFKLNITEEEERILRLNCENELGCGYDIIGIIFSIVLPWHFENPWWWFCSEFVTAMLQRIGIMEGIEACATSPDKFFRHFIESKITKV